MNTFPLTYTLYPVKANETDSALYLTREEVTAQVRKS